jgi:hypothetical protein
MPISEKRLAASRLNGAKSKGPTSEIGKRNSSRNSTRHGMLARAVLVDNESTGRFADLVNRFHVDINPDDNIERVFIEKMSAAHWHASRMWALESAGINYETRRMADSIRGEDPPTQTMLAIRSIGDEERHADTLGRYARRYEREYYAAFEGLLRYREQKNAARTRQQQQIKGPPQTVEPATTPVEPAPDPHEPTPATLEPAKSPATPPTPILSRDGTGALASDRAVSDSIHQPSETNAHPTIPPTR